MDVIKIKIVPFCSILARIGVHVIILSAIALFDDPPRFFGVRTLVRFLILIKRQSLF